MLWKFVTDSVTTAGSHQAVTPSPTQMLPSSTRRRVAFVLLASFAVVTSCDEAPTLPSHSLAPGKANHDALIDADEMAPAEVSGSVLLGGSQFLGHYPQRTKVFARVSGLTTLTDGVETWTYGIAGHPYAGGGIGFSQGYGNNVVSGGNVFDWADTVYVQGDLSLVQAGQGIFVGENGRPWTMTGHAEASVLRLDATLGLGDAYGNGPFTMTEMHAVEGQYVLLIPRAVEGATLPAAVDPATWLFTPDTGGPPRSVCSIALRTLCEMTVPEAGTVTVTGYANGGPPTTVSMHFIVPTSTIKLHLSRDSVTVGDTVFVTTEIINAQSSEISGYAYDAPEWATGTCVTGYGAGLASCYIVLTGPGTITVYAYIDGRGKSASGTIKVTEAVQAPPTLAVKCPPAAVRGQEIACTIALSDATLPFSVTSITGGATSGNAVFTLGLKAPGSMAAGAVYTLKGPAVATTHLTVTGGVAWNGKPVDLVKEASFTVAKRPAESDEYVMKLRPVADGPGRTVKYPSSRTVGGALGLYSRQAPQFDELQVAMATTGPNEGLSYVVSIPGIPASLINLTFAIFPGDPWYEAHPDHSGSLNDVGQPICTKAQIDVVRLRIERHEGITQADNSHFGIDQELLRKWKLGAYMGSHVISMKGSADEIRQQMALDFAAEWQSENEVLQPMQANFDSVDTSTIYAGLGCSIYLRG